MRPCQIGRSDSFRTIALSMDVKLLNFKSALFNLRSIRRVIRWLQRAERLCSSLQR